MSSLTRTSPRLRWSPFHVQTVALRFLRPLVIAALLIACLLPFWYMIVLSMRPIEKLLHDPARLWIAFDEFSLDSYAEVLLPPSAGGQGFLVFIGNSAIVALGSVVLALVVAIPGAYAIARLPFFGRRQVGVLFLAAYMFPAIIIAIPLFAVFTRLGLRGSLLGLVLVYAAQTIPVAIYMLRNYLASVPVSVEEAGLVDGLSRYGVMWRISLRLSLPSIMATGLFVFMIAWNEFLFALLFLVDRPAQWTVSLGLSRLSGGVEVPATVLMAGSVVLTLPIVLLFFATEKLLTGGLTAGAEKG